MAYIESGKKDGATVHTGGVRHGDEGFFIQPTIFTDVKPGMKIIQEEIFGPVGAIIKFKDEAGTQILVIASLDDYVLSKNFCTEVIEQANDTVYGLACSVFSENIGRALRVAHALEAGTAWVRHH